MTDDVNELIAWCREKCGWTLLESETYELKEVADTLERLAAENDRLREALEQYADRKNWAYFNAPGYGEFVLFKATWDGQDLARAALQEPKP